MLKILPIILYFLLVPFGLFSNPQLREEIYRIRSKKEYTFFVLLSGAIMVASAYIFQYRLEHILDGKEFNSSITYLLSTSLSIPVFLSIFATYQDLQTKKVDRHILRVCTVLEIILTTSITYLLYTNKAWDNQDIMTFFISLSVFMILYFICLIFMSRVSPSDFRMLMLLLPLEILIARYAFHGIILLSLVVSEIFIKIQQKKAKEEIRVPLAPTIMITSTIILTTIAMTTGFSNLSIINIF